VHRAGASVVGKAISEDIAGPLEQHIIWPGEPMEFEIVEDDGMMAILPDFLRRPFAGERCPHHRDRRARHPHRNPPSGPARRMTMRLAPDGSEIRISMPQWGRTADALVFAKSRREWLAGQLTRHVAPAPLAHGHTCPFAASAGGRPCSGPAPPAAVIEGCGWAARWPGWTPASAAGSGRGQGALCRRSGLYCARAQQPTLALTNARSRWGSCSGQGDPAELAPGYGARCVRRSVVAHEVAHLSISTIRPASTPSWRTFSRAISTRPIAGSKRMGAGFTPF
jgi:hypothetical protein